MTIHNPALASGQIEAENLSAQSHGLSLLSVLDWFLQIVSAAGPVFLN